MSAFMTICRSGEDRALKFATLSPALKGRGGRNEPVLIVSEYKVGTVVGDGICEALLHTYVGG